MQIYILDNPLWHVFDQNVPIIMPGIKIAKKLVMQKYEPEDDDDILMKESESEYDDIKIIKPEKSIYEFDDDEYEDNNKPTKLFKKLSSKDKTAMLKTLIALKNKNNKITI